MKTTYVQRTLNLNLSWLANFASFLNILYFIPSLSSSYPYCTFYMRLLILLRTHVAIYDKLDRQLSYTPFNLNLRRNWCLSTIRRRSKRYIFWTPRLTISNSTIWTAKYLLLLLRYPLMGLSYNRTHYRAPETETIKVVPRLRSIQNRPNRFLTSIHSLQFLSKIHLFRTWLITNHERQSLDYQRIYTTKTKRWAIADHIHQLNPSLNLLFLDIKRPSVASIQLNCREIITFLSKFKNNVSTVSRVHKQRGNLFESILRSRIQTRVRRSRNLFLKSIRYDRFIRVVSTYPAFSMSSISQRSLCSQKIQSSHLRYREACLLQNLQHVKVNFVDKSWRINSNRSVKNLCLNRFLNLKTQGKWNRNLKFYRFRTTQNFRQHIYFNRRWASSSLSNRSSLVTTSINLTFLSKQFNLKSKRTSLEDHNLGLLCLPTQLRRSFSVLASPLKIFVYPKHTRRFKRSPFFFLLLLQESRLTAIDWLTSVLNYSPFYTFTLFPVANSFKISIFKRLNMQKRLLTSQIYSYDELSTVNLYTKLPARLAFFANRLILRSHECSTFNFSRAQWQLLVKYSKYQINDSSKYLRIRRLKFKPGYSRLWRESRVDIKEILEMKLRYQNRLTLKLHHLHRHQDKGPATYSTATIFFALLGAQISVDMWSTLELFRNEVIYLNGKLCTNHYTQLFLQDLIQVVINLKFYFLMRFLQNQIFLTIARFNKIFYRKYRTRTTHSFVRVHKKLPWTFFHLQNAHLDILPYLEVDYFTLSSFVILDQRALKLWVPIRAYTLELNILNMYNWKYIT